MRPALWVGLTVWKQSRLAKDHPDWILRDSGGNPIETHHSPGAQFAVDTSVPAVRQYIKKAFNIAIRKWGFDGIKLDFFTHQFNIPSARFAREGWTGSMGREFVFRTIRELLPEDGYFMACYGGMGNQFMGKYADTFRCGCDVNAGFWRYLLRSIEWSVHMMRIGFPAVCIPDIDSVGFLANLSRDECRLWLNYALACRSLVETGGDFPNELPNNLKDTQKALLAPVNGESVYFGDFSTGNEQFPPEVWYFNGCAFSTVRNNPHLPSKFVALFNFKEQARPKQVSLESLGLDTKRPYVFIDYWNNRAFHVKNQLAIKLAKHGSEAFHVVRLDGPACIVDADVRIDDVRMRNHQMVVSVFGYGRKRLKIFNKQRIKTVNIYVEGQKDALITL